MCLEKSGKTWDFSVQNFFSLESGSPGSTFPHVDGIAISSQEICGFDSWPIHYHGMTRGSIIWYWSKGGMIWGWEGSNLPLGSQVTCSLTVWSLTGISPSDYCICVIALERLFQAETIAMETNTVCPWPLPTLTFDLETGMRVASMVGNLPSKFGHCRPLGSGIIRCIRRMDKAKQCLLPPSLRSAA